MSSDWKSRVGVRVVPTDPSDFTMPGRIVDLAQEAEASGLGVIAVPERLGPGGVPSALVVCAAIASATARIAVATAVIPLPLHHPLRVAEDVATVDGIAGGRLELGIGLGVDRQALAGFGYGVDSRIGRFEESIAILRAAWADGPIEHRGRQFNIDQVEVFPKPSQPGGPPLWVGVRAEAALRRAGRLGLGLLIEPGTAYEPYLDECRSTGSTPRIAVTGTASGATGLAEEIATTADVRAELWIETDPAQPNALDAALEISRASARHTSDS